MTSLKRQYFFSYAVIGSVMPLITVYLRDDVGFDFFQIGMANSLMSLPILFSPALITFLADRKFDTRRILALSFAISSLVLTAIYFSRSIPLTLFLYFCHGVSFVAMIPLQDGFYFSLREHRRKTGGTFSEYPHVRVWGTMGFIVPSLILYFPLSAGAAPGSILPVAVVFCLFSLANSFTLPPSPPRDSRGPESLPTRQALQQLFSPKGRWLAVGLFFALLAASVYYAFIANYMDEVVSIPRQYIGLIFNIGVLLEVGYTFLMPRLQRSIGLKAIICLGMAMMFLRMLLLALFPHPAVAMAVQVVHGLEVLALFLAPPVFLNRLAGDAFRNSMQGIYTMLVGGLSRVIGGVTAGWIVSSGSLRGGLLFGASLALVGFLIITFKFRRIPRSEEMEHH